MRQITLFFISWALAGAALAAPPSAESIDALLAATKAEKLVDSMYANVDQMMRQSMAASLQKDSLNAEQKRILDTAPTKLAQVFREEMTWSKLRPIYIQIYQESFSQEEVDGLIAFYKSPAGLAFVDKMPLVMQKSLMATQTLMNPMLDKIKTVMQQVLADVKAAQ